MSFIRGGFRYTLTSKNDSPKRGTSKESGGEQGNIFIQKLMTQVLKFPLNF
jgi:hypothetical protein